ncbi:MAG: ABC transporter permease [Dehalococcoidia bacterium]
MRLIWVYVRLGALNELQYQANFYIQVLQSLLALGTGLGGLWIVFAHTDSLNGWRGSELLALLGIYLLVGGLVNLVIQPGLQRFLELLRLGTLDFTLTKPADAQLLVSVGQINLWKLVDVAVGVGVLVIALVQLGAGIGAGQAFAFAVALVTGSATIYSFWLILASAAFWFVRIENIFVIFQSMYEAGRWPVAIYPPALRATLTFLVPVAFATTVPAEALTGRLTPTTLLGSIALAISLLIASRRLWLIGVRHYSGASA